MCVRGNKFPKAIFTEQIIGEDVVVTDLATSLMWQKTYPASTYSWKNALKYCEDLTYAGYSDWRLPNKNELSSLLNYDKTEKPYSDFPDMPSSNAIFFSSSNGIVGLHLAWRVAFVIGDVDGGSKDADSLVRCVR